MPPRVCRVLRGNGFSARARSWDRRVGIFCFRFVCRELARDKWFALGGGEGVGVVAVMGVNDFFPGP